MWKWMLLLIVTASVAARADEPPADERLLFADNEPGYVGGLGLVTLESATGMFLNPTSGNLSGGQLTAQYCAAIRKQDHQLFVWNQPMVAYGITDWLELGGFAVIDDESESTTAAGGPWFRLRAIKDEGWRPEVSIGAIIREGNRELQRETIFLAGSKGMSFDNRFLHSARVHLGFRQLWQNGAANPPHGSIIYTGAEVGLPKDLYALAEVSNRSSTYAHVPFAFGLQARLPQGFGFSIAGIQPGDDDGIGVYVGIGVNFL